MWEQEQLQNPWVGASFGRSAVAHAVRLSQAFESAFVGNSDDVFRDVVRTSWMRCQRAGLSPERNRVVDRGGRDAADERWERHPLRPYTEHIEIT